jgi:HD superfamily phosphohydrolase
MPFWFRAAWKTAYLASMVYGILTWSLDATELRGVLAVSWVVFWIMLSLLSSKQTRLEKQLKLASAARSLSASRIWQRAPTVGYEVLLESGAYNARFADPVHGQIELSPRTACILELPIVQRLAHIAQLPFCSFRSPAASYSCLQHSMGAGYLCRESLRRLLDSNVVVTPRGVCNLFPLNAGQREQLLLLAELAGFLRDIGQGPFAHATDPIARAFLRDRAHGPIIHLGLSRVDAIPDDYLPPPLKSRLRCILSSRASLDGYDGVIKQLVDHSLLDAARLDYLERDAAGSRAPEESIDAMQIISCLRFCSASRSDDVPSLAPAAEELRLALDGEALPALRLYVHARQRMYVNVYDNGIERLCQRLLTKALWTVLYPDFLSIQGAARGGATADVVDRDALDQNAFDRKLEQILALTDVQLLDYLFALGAGAPPIASLLENLTSRPQYHRVFHSPVDPATLGEPLSAHASCANSMSEKQVLIELSRLEVQIARALHLDEQADAWKIAITLPKRASWSFDLPIVERTIDQAAYKPLTTHSDRPISNLPSSPGAAPGQVDAHRMSVFVHTSVLSRTDNETIVRTIEDCLQRGAAASPEGRRESVRTN